MNPFEMMLKHAAEDDEENLPLPLPEAQIMELRNYAKRYRRCTFKPGDLITPAGNSMAKGAGRPHLVLEVLQEPMFLVDDESEPGSNLFGARPDIRVLAFTDRPGGAVICAYWVESYQFVPYVEQTEDEATDDVVAAVLD